MDHNPAPLQGEGSHRRSHDEVRPHGSGAEHAERARSTASSQAHPERPKVPDITTLSLVVDYLAACWIQPLPQPAVNSAWEILPSLSVSTI